MSDDEYASYSSADESCNLSLHEQKPSEIYTTCDEDDSYGVSIDRMAVRYRINV